MFFEKIAWPVESLSKFCFKSLSNLFLSKTRVVESTDMDLEIFVKSCKRFERGKGLFEKGG